MKSHIIPRLTVLSAVLASAQLAAAAVTILPTHDSRGRVQDGVVTTIPTADNDTRLGVGPVDGSDDYFRSYLAFDLTSELAAVPTETLTVNLFDAGANENNTTTGFTQNFTLFQVASDWDGVSPLPGGTDLASVELTFGTGNAVANLSFSSAALTSAFNDAVGGMFYLGIYSPEGEAAAPGTRSFLWLSSLESSTAGGGSDSGARPSLTYTPIPEPSTALLGGLGLLYLLRRRR